MKIKYIDLVFENCEYARLLPNMFNSLIIDEITKSYYINCFQYKNGEVSEFINCDNFYIEINKKGLKTKTFMGEETVNIVKDRILRHSDITHIQVYFDNETDEYIGVPYKGELDINEFQKVKMMKNNMIIEIKLEIGRPDGSSI